MDSLHKLVREGTAVYLMAALSICVAPIGLHAESLVVAVLCALVSFITAIVAIVQLRLASPEDRLGIMVFFALVFLALGMKQLI